MRIREIAVDGFGLLHGTRLPPSAGLTIVRGQNEAGKTTLLSFVRAILFGFETNKHRAMAGGQRGGWLDVEMEDGRQFRIERYGERGGPGRLRVLDSEGADQGSARLPQLLQGVEQKVFRNIFAFGLDELSQFDRLNDNEVAARIYGAGLGLGAVSALDVEGGLRGAKEALFKPGGRTPEINALLHEIELIDAGLREQNPPREYGELQTAIHGLENRLAEIDRDMATVGHEFRSCERVVKAWPTWVDLTANKQARARLGTAIALQGDEIESLVRLESDLSVAQKALAEAVELREQTESALEAIDIDLDVIGREVEIEALLEEGRRDQSRTTETDRVGNERDLAAARLSDAMHRLGPGWEHDQVARFDDSVPVGAEIAGRFRSNLDAAASRLLDVRRDQLTNDNASREAEREIEGIERDIAAIASEERAGGDSGVLAEALRTVEGLQAQIQASETNLPSVPDENAAPERPAERLVACRAASGVLDRARVISDLAGEQGQAGPPRARRGVASIAGLVMAAASLVVLVALAVPAPVAVAVAIGLGLVVALGTPRLLSATAFSVGATMDLQAQVGELRREAERLLADAGLETSLGPTELGSVISELETQVLEVTRRELLQSQVDGISRTVSAIEAKLDQVWAGLGSEYVGETKSDQLRARVEAARRRDARRIGLAEQLESLERRKSHLASRKNELSAAMKEAEEAQAEVRKEWAAWLVEHGLDPRLDRETAAHVVEAVTDAKEPLAALAKLEEQMTRLAEAHHAFAEALLLLASQLGLRRPNRDHVSEMVIEIRSRLNKAIESQRKHKELETSLDGSVEAEKRARAALDVAIQCFDLFLGTFRVADVATLRAEVRRAAEISDLEARIDAREKSLVALSGPGEAFEVLARSLGSVDDIVEVEARTQQLEASLSELGSERDGLHEKSGAAHDRARILERDDSATDARQHRSDVLAQLEASAERWSVLALATAVLATARAGYEEAHRPAVVGAAEEYFRAWTDGRYIRILAPIGGQIEGVEHRDGTRVELADLSRGTAEQLYLALRFGLVRHFAGGAESLPIVMDDILVNFDDERAALAARSIEDLARHQQILYFTCHPETPLHGTEVVLPRLRGVPSSA